MSSKVKAVLTNMAAFPGSFLVFPSRQVALILDILITSTCNFTQNLFILYHSSFEDLKHYIFLLKILSTIYDLEPPEYKILKDISIPATHKHSAQDIYSVLVFNTW